MPNVIIMGPAYPLRGGIASFNERLARAFQQEGWNVEIYTFSLQYPTILFPGTSQFSNELKPTDLKINVCINSVNPFNWIRIGLKLKQSSPDLIIVRYWIPFMGPCLGTILKFVKKINTCKIICIADNVVPHEKRIGDAFFTRYFINKPDAFITMSAKVDLDLKKFLPNSKSIITDHPLFDNFGKSIPKDVARNILNLPKDEKIIMFFGFIRKYKGLDLLIEAFNYAILKTQNIKLLIAGEFYDESKPYLDLIDKFGIQDKIYLHTHYIPDSEIKNYFSAADLIVQPYRHATQSGVTPLAYYFDKPMVVTDVGGLASLVPHKIAGLVCQPTSEDLANTIVQFFNMDETIFQNGIQVMKKKLSWATLITHIKSLANSIQKNNKT
ncbi:MAG: glycosyltransferase [Saprospiraceae bacterium]|nr:glycosyltransferase [Saprospiraceae bacterium]MBK8484977.1 glycosyltransferase [Saprospiraceae bacterium]MBK9223213.1 glycosyltransferase [Saprospiraceae bacterium]